MVAVDSHFDKFPLYLKAQDIMEATQYSQTFVYELIKQIEVQIPGSVVRGRRKGTRVYSPVFWPWFMNREGIADQ